MSIPLIPDSVERTLVDAARASRGDAEAAVNLAQTPVGVGVGVGLRATPQGGGIAPAVGGLGEIASNFDIGDIPGSIRAVSNAAFDRLRAGAMQIGLYVLGIVLVIVGLLIVFRNQIGSLVGVSPVTRARRAVQGAVS